MRVRVNTQMEQSLQLLFRASESVHGKTLADALELGVRDILKDIDPIGILEGDITHRTEELEVQRNLLASMRLLSPEQKKLKQFEKSVDELEAMREKHFLADMPQIMRDIRRGDANWNRILWDYQFDTRREATAWFRKRIERYEREKQGEKGGTNDRARNPR